MSACTIYGLLCRVTAISPGAVQTEFSNIRFKVGRLYFPPSGLCYLLSASSTYALTAQGQAQSVLLSLSLACADFRVLAQMGVSACRAIRMLQMQFTVAYSRSQQVSYRSPGPCRSSTGCLSSTRRLRQLFTLQIWLLTCQCCADAEDIADQIVYAATR